MSGGNKLSQVNPECVIGDVRDCIAEYRYHGRDTVTAIWLASEALKIAARRVKTLFYRDRDILMIEAERYRLAMDCAALMKRLGAEQIIHGEATIAKAEAIIARETNRQQLALPLGGQKWSGFVNGSVKRAA